MPTEPETQGPPRRIEVVNRRNGVQYGMKWVTIRPKKIKDSAS